MEISNFVEIDAEMDKKDLSLTITVLHLLELTIGSYLGDKQNISYSYSKFLEGIKNSVKLSNKARPLFLDIGCGLGTKGYLASHFGCIPYGIEINDKYADIARLFGNEVTTCNALKYNNYQFFDIIYWYQEDVLNEQLKTMIKKCAKNGCVLFIAENPPVILNN